MPEDINIIDYPGSFHGFEDLNSTGSNDPYNDYYNFILENTDRNNAWSAKQAQKQMDFQSAQAALERSYGSLEAAKNRDWQKMMSDTAHQREIADLKAAGLNPVLSAMNGNGAAVGSGAAASRTGAPSGAKGDTDQSGNMAIVSMLGSFLQAQTQLETARVSAEASMAVADKYTAMEKIIQTMKNNYGKWEHENYPNSWFGVAEALIAAMTNDNPGNTAKGIFQSLKEIGKETSKSKTDLADLFQGSKGTTGGSLYLPVTENFINYFFKGKNKNKNGGQGKF